MRHNIVESIIGAVVLLIAASFIMLSYRSGNLSSTNGGYILRAQFTNIGNLNIGSDVRLGGIKVGTITNQYLDPANYWAVVEINVNNTIKLPRDSSAAIVSDGLLGSKYLSLEPGASEEYLSAGDLIEYTQNSVNLESLIAKFAFGGVDKKDDETKDSDLLD